MQTKKILLLLNGGTISQVSKKLKTGETVLVPPKDATEFLEAIGPVLENFDDYLQIDCELVTTKDSTNMTPEDWSLLAKRIQKAQNEEEYDGVGVTHGTDTLPYTAAALSFALHGSNPNGSALKIPVCVTGSQKTIYTEGTDAYHNLTYMFKVLNDSVDQGIADVMVNFDQEVFLGSRLIKISEVNFRAFASPNYPPVGVISNDELFLNAKLLNAADSFFPQKNPQIEFARGIISFDLNPGTDPSVISAILHTGNVSGIIFRCFAEGNVCFEGEYNLLPVIETAVKEKNIPLFLTSKIPAANASASHYEVGVKAIAAGGIPCYDQTDVVVGVKLAWLIANGLCRSMDDFKEAMRTSYTGELTTTMSVLG